MSSLSCYNADMTTNTRQGSGRLPNATPTLPSSTSSSSPVSSPDQLARQYKDECRLVRQFAKACLEQTGQTKFIIKPGSTVDQFLLRFNLPKQNTNSISIDTVRALYDRSDVM